MMRAFVAGTILGDRINVRIDGNGVMRSIRLNGVPLRSVYEADSVVNDARSIVARRFGAIETWEASHDRAPDVRIAAGPKP